jgi:hypothetical protein
MALIYRPHTNIWQYRHTGSELALSARSAAMGRAVIAGGFSAAVAVRSAAAGPSTGSGGRPGVGFTGVLGARAVAAGAARGAGILSAC